MFTADVHNITKVEKISVERLGEGFAEGGYITITLRSGSDGNYAKYTFFADDLNHVWETFGNAMINADAVYEDKYGEKTNG